MDTWNWWKSPRHGVACDAVVIYTGRARRRRPLIGIALLIGISGLSGKQGNWEQISPDSRRE